MYYFEMNYASWSNIHYHNCFVPAWWQWQLSIYENVQWIKKKPRCIVRALNFAKESGRSALAWTTTTRTIVPWTRRRQGRTIPRTAFSKLNTTPWVTFLLADSVTSHSIGVSMFLQGRRHLPASTPRISHNFQFSIAKLLTLLRTYLRYQYY